MHGCMSSRNMLSPSNKLVTKQAQCPCYSAIQPNVRGSRYDSSHGPKLRTGWHGMPTDSLIIAEFDKWRMYLGQAPCL